MNREELLLKVKVSQYLKSLGIENYFKGYKYLVTGIIYKIKNEDASLNDIYKAICKKHNSKYEKVERDIRYALMQITTENKTNENINLKKVTNKSFLFYVPEVILADEVKYTA